jgi:hypothetical protein
VASLGAHGAPGRARGRAADRRRRPLPGDADGEAAADEDGGRRGAVGDDERRLVLDLRDRRLHADHRRHVLDLPPVGRRRLPARALRRGRLVARVERADRPQPLVPARGAPTGAC